MKVPLWLAWRELVSRRFALVTAVAMVCTAVAFCTAIELVSRAREEAVATQIDHIGPALRLIPAGRTASDLARFELGADFFSLRDVERVRTGLSSRARGIERRLLLKLPLDGRAVPAIGVDPGRVITPFDALRRLRDGEIVLGNELAHRLKKKANDGISIKGSRFRVAAVLPETASAEDTALFLPLRTLQNLSDLPEAANEIRVFPAAGSGVDSAVAYLESEHPKVKVINTYRGETAEHDMGHSLYQHRRVLYLITASIVAMCIFIWSYLNVAERRLEVATVMAIGGTWMTVLCTIVLRAVVVSFMGALAGYAVGASIALVQDFESSFGVAFSSELLFVMTGGAVALSILGAFPASMVSAFKKHVMVLQEW